MEKRTIFRAAMALLAAFALGLKPPPSGKPVAPTPEEAAARDAALRAFGGKIVWSSNRAGSHDIWILDGPGKEPRRLTHSAFTDTYPRFSPDGRLVAFSRSTEPWVSQRNFEKWDTWVVDVETGRERHVATNAYQACWNLDDYGITNIVLVRNGGKTLETGRFDKTKFELFDILTSGRPPIGDGVFITLPDMPTSQTGVPGEEILATLRGAQKATVHIWRPLMGEEIRESAGGCQMVWRKRCSSYPLPWLHAGATNTEEEVVWVDHPGRMKNAFYTFDYSEPDYWKRKRIVLLDAENPWSHEYFPRFAEGGRWLVYGASQGGHEQDSEDYEIFLWDSANTNTPPARLTFHTGNDCWPDILAPAK